MHKGVSAGRSQFVFVSVKYKYKYKYKYQKSKVPKMKNTAGKFASKRQKCTRGGQVVDRKQDESVGYQIYQISKQIYLIYFIIPG